MHPETLQVMAACERLLRALTRGERLSDPEAQALMLKLMVVYAAITDDESRESQWPAAGPRPQPRTETA